jgi:hypothetical protein
LKIKRLSLTAFFIVLTLSIGLVSVNFPLTVKAQNNELSQNGNGNAEQETGQVQSSSQNGQVVSGEGNTLSGNNLLCQSMEDSKIVPSLCSPDGLSELPPTSPDRDLALLNVTVTTTTTSPCGPESFHCPFYLMHIIIFDENQKPVTSVDDVISVSQQLYYVDVPIGAYELYAVPIYTLWGFPENTFSGDCVQSQSDPQYCKGTMTEQGGHVKINYHFDGED